MGDHVIGLLSSLSKGSPTPNCSDLFMRGISYAKNLVRVSSRGVSAERNLSENLSACQKSSRVSSTVSLAADHNRWLARLYSMLTSLLSTGNRMSFAIASIGLATAQGNTADIASGAALRSPTEWPSPPSHWTTSGLCRPAVGIEPLLAGSERWRALAKMALQDCLGDQAPFNELPLIVASCNGGAGEFDSESWERAFDCSALLAGTPWSDRCLPIFSASCNSGLHALYAAEQLLAARATDEVLVLAADILSSSNYDNFAGLRVLAKEQTSPWQQTSTGFVLGEAAVALRLIRARDDEELPIVTGPALAGELAGGDGLVRVLTDLSPNDTGLILGQGTGPLQVDEAELSALQAFVGKEVPLATPLVNFGHTLGASGLLAVALAALAQQAPRVFSYFVTSVTRAMDGRPLSDGTKVEGSVLVSCRALSGACAGAILGHSGHLPGSRSQVWRAQTRSDPLMHKILRKLAAEAPQNRPDNPPDVLIVRLDRPLSPPAEAVIGGRLLPSAVLELTPGFVPQLVARCWGFDGAALCLVGDDGADALGLTAACVHLGLKLAQINILGSGDNRAVEWNV